MYSNGFNNKTTIKAEEGLLTGISWFYAQFMTGDINEEEFSDLIDLHIELSPSA